MRAIILFATAIFLCPILGFSQERNESLNEEKESVQSDTSESHTTDNEITRDSSKDTKKEKKTINLVTDSLFLVEKSTFDSEIEYVNNLLEEEKKKESFMDLTTVETKHHGFKFIKEFTTQDDKIYHYVMFDAQLQSSLFRISKKNQEIIYQDELLKLETEGEMMLYSIILSEKIIGSLESFKKVYYTVYKEDALRVTASGSGQHHFFKEFEKMYYDDDKNILKGKRFRSIKELVYFFNNNLPNQQNQ